MTEQKQFFLPLWQTVSPQMSLMFLSKNLANSAFVFPPILTFDG